MEFEPKKAVACKALRTKKLRTAKRDVQNLLDSSQLTASIFSYYETSRWLLFIFRIVVYFAAA